MAKITFLTPGGEYFGQADDRGQIITASAQLWGHFSGDSIISPAGVLLGNIRGDSMVDPDGKIILLVRREQ
jgi:hypothetical protein